MKYLIQKYILDRAEISHRNSISQIMAWKSMISITEVTQSTMHHVVLMHTQNGFVLKYAVLYTYQEQPSFIMDFQAKYEK